MNNGSGALITYVKRHLLWDKNAGSAVRTNNLVGCLYLAELENGCTIRRIGNY